MEKQLMIDTLEKVKPGLSKTGMLEQTDSFIFLEDYVITYNGELLIKQKTENIPIKGIVKAEELFNLLYKINKDTIEINCTENEVLVKWGKGSEAGLVLKEDIAIPFDEVIEFEREWIDIPENFLKYLSFTSKVCSMDLSRPLLTCVHIQTNGTIEGSDGYRGVICNTTLQLTKNILIPAKLVAEIVKLKPDQIAEGNNWVHFRTSDGLEISCRIFEDDRDKFPNLAGLIPTDGKELTFPKTISDILDRIQIFSQRDHFLEESMLVSVSNRQIELSAESDAGWIKEKANISYKGESFTFGITPQLFKDILLETTECIYTKKFIKFQEPDWIYIASLRSLEDTLRSG